MAVSAVLAVVFSVTSPILQSHSQTVWQINTPAELQGRVFAVRRLVAQATGPVGIVIAGVVGGLANPGYVMTAFGLASVTYCVVSILSGWWRLVERADRRHESAAGRTT